VPTRSATTTQPSDECFHNLIMTIHTAIMALAPDAQSTYQPRCIRFRITPSGAGCMSAKVCSQLGCADVRHYWLWNSIRISRA